MTEVPTTTPLEATQKPPPSPAESWRSWSGLWRRKTNVIAVFALTAILAHVVLRYGVGTVFQASAGPRPLHAGGMGTTALGLILLVGLLGTPRRWTTVLGVALGAGGFGYSFYWMWAGFRALGLGSTGLAKESLKWLAMPSSGAFVLATVAVLFVLISALMSRRVPGTHNPLETT